MAMVSGLERADLLDAHARYTRLLIAALALHSALEAERRHALLWLSGLGKDVGRVLTDCAAAMRSGTAPPQPAFRLDPPPDDDLWTRVAFAERR